MARKGPKSGAGGLSEVPAFWAVPEDELLHSLGTTRAGLSREEAARRLADQPTRAQRSTHSDASLLIRQFRNPIVLLLLAAAGLSIVLRDTTDAGIILAIVFGSGLLGFIQERGAVRAVDALRSQVQVQSEVVRDGVTVSIALADVVPGDLVLLRAGDVVPADCRIIRADQLRADEAALTGESYPRTKRPGELPAVLSMNERSNAVFFGTHVISGSGAAVAVATGPQTVFGNISIRLARHVPTDFERGVTRFGYLLIRATALLVAGILLVNLLLGRPWIDSVLFSLALAVGLTPQMLPAIVTLSLSLGARSMAKRRVIVKRLDAIEDIGEIDTLCTDKTGTITSGAVQLDGAVDTAGNPSERVRYLGWLNAKCQQAFSNPIDQAILADAPREFQDQTLPRVIAELPYDFTRKRLSVAVELPDGPTLITKGAVEPVLDCCRSARRTDGSTVAIEGVRADIDALVASLSAEGFRVIAIAHRTLTHQAAPTVEDESGLELDGLLTFGDPPKPGAAEAISDLRELGISVRIITGDNRLAAAHIGSEVGLSVSRVVTGAEIDLVSDADLRACIEDVTVFAEVDPLQKERIVGALRDAGHVVGYLGDGINDAPALHIADVGISVQSAVDVAKQSADLVLLEKDLGVLRNGIEEGRRVFANTMKYVFVTTSANFGNMLSMAAAAAFLPFLPLLPRQILLLNFMSDIPGTTIATDNVDDEQVERPRAWDVTRVRNFMVVFGLISSAFDILTFVVLRVVMNASAETFRTAWFIESTATELAVMLVLRTPRVFFRSLPGRGLLWSSALVAAATLAVPYSPFAGALGMVALEARYLGVLACITAGYVVLTEAGKRLFPGLLR
jgi:Mg2+-importing ATPase